MLQSGQGWRDDDGAALLEMAIMLPFLCITVFGVFEVGHLMWQYQQIQSGVRDGARYLSRVSDPTVSTTICAPAVLANFETKAKQIAVTGAIGGATNRVSWWNTSDITISYPTIANLRDATTGLSPYRGPDPIRIVQVTTTASYPGVGMLTYIGFPTPFAFTISHNERCIGSG
jgi:Flp pilus assembly protein TadG